MAPSTSEMLDTTLFRSTFTSFAVTIPELRIPNKTKSFSQSHFGPRRFSRFQYQRSQHREIFHILVQVFGFGSFKAARRIGETRVVHDVPKSLFADLALADVLVPIDARAEVRLRIVQVQSKHLVETDQRVDL